jgi:branched-chain amino acid transport system substrate-binding protein
MQLMGIIACLTGLVIGGFFAAVASTSASAAENIKLGLIEPFSGPVAAVGIDALQAFETAAEQVNAAGGVLGGRNIEIVGLDNAMSAEKTTQQLKKAVDMGLKYIIQGIGSNHALNIIKFVNKHNKRNPDKAIMFLNHSAVTTAFTNELCSFWHFRFDANVDMKVAGLVTQMSRDSSIKKVYMINQNYAYGKSFQAAARTLLKERTPGIELVGDELIVPFGKVQDFTPYIAKIKASGADTILTGNWGPDLVRLVKFAAGANLPAQFYTIYGGLTSSVAGYGADSQKVTLKQVNEYHENHDGLSADSMAFGYSYLAKYQDTWYSDRQRWLILMLAEAIDKAGSDDPIAVGKALEGLTFQGPLGEVQMRASDHQIQMQLMVSSLTGEYARPIMYKGNDFHIAFATDGTISREDTTLPTTCDMQRPY